MPNKSPFDTPYTGRSGNNETGLFACDIYVARKIQNRDTWRKSNEIGLHRGSVLYFIWIHMAATCYVHIRSARNVRMIQLARALKRKYHFDETFITGCTGSCLPVQSVIKFCQNDDIPFQQIFEYICLWLTESGRGSHSYVVDCLWNKTL